MRTEIAVEKLQVCISSLSTLISHQLQYVAGETILVQFNIVTEQIRIESILHQFFYKVGNSYTSESAVALAQHKSVSRRRRRSEDQLSDDEV